MSWMNTAQFALPECFLDVSAMRQTIVSSSVANVDTPGYHVLSRCSATPKTACLNLTIEEAGRQASIWDAAY
jgi:hypothetical protein